MVLFRGEENQPILATDFAMKSKNLNKVVLPFFGNLCGELVEAVEGAALSTISTQDYNLLSGRYCDGLGIFWREDQEVKYSVDFNIQAKRIIGRLYASFRIPAFGEVSAFVPLDFDDEECVEVLDAYFAAKQNDLYPSSYRYYHSSYIKWKSARKIPST